MLKSSYPIQGCPGSGNHNPINSQFALMEIWKETEGVCSYE